MSFNFWYRPTRHSVPLFLFCKVWDARRNGHRLDSEDPRLPDGYRRGPAPVLPKVNADYRLTGGRRNLPGHRQLEILDCQRSTSMILLGGWDVSRCHVLTSVANRAFNRGSPSAGRVPFLQAVACGTPARWPCPGFPHICGWSAIPIPRLAVALDGLDVGAVVAAAVDEIVPPTALRGCERADKQGFKGAVGLAQRSVEMASNISRSRHSTAQAPRHRLL